MAQVDDKTWQAALAAELQKTPGLDPSWFVPNYFAQTGGDRLEQMKREYLQNNPGARDWSPEIKDAMQYMRPDAFGSLAMTPEGAQAYDDMITRRNHKDDLGNVLTTAALAAAAFGGAGLMNPASGAGTGTLSSLGFEPPSLMGSTGLSLGAPAAIDYAALSIPELAAAGGTAGGIGTLGSMGFEAPSLMGSVAPELSAPLSTLGSEAAASQLALGGAPMGVFGDIPAVPDVGGPVAAIPEHSFLPVAAVPTMAAGGIGSMLGNALGGIGSKLIDSATSPSGIATLIGAGLGAASGGGTNTATTQSKTDPRIDPFIYGDQGVLQNAQKLYQQNPSGINSTMQQGLDMQRSALNDPAYAQSYQNMRTLGNQLMTPGFMQQGLLSPTSQAGGAGGLLGAQERAKALIAKGQGLLG